MQRFLHVSNAKIKNFSHEIDAFMNGGNHFKDVMLNREVDGKVRRGDKEVTLSM